jgi:hypothetical protein
LHFFAGLVGFLQNGGRFAVLIPSSLLRLPYDFSVPSFRRAFGCCRARYPKTRKTPQILLVKLEIAQPISFRLGSRIVIARTIVFKRFASLAGTVRPEMFSHHMAQGMFVQAFVFLHVLPAV